MPALALVLAAVLSVEFGAALAVTLFDEVGPLGTVVLRTVAGCLVLLLLFRPRIRGRARHELALAAAFGLVLAAMNTCFFLALERIPLGITVTLEFVGPLGLAVALSRRALDLVWVALAGAGIALLSGGETGGNLAGILLALAAGGCWAGYILLSARVGRVFPGPSGLAVATLVGSLVLLGPGIAQGGADLLDGRVLGLGLTVGVLSTAIPYSLELEALRRVPPRVFGVLMSLGPAAGGLAGALVLDQRLAAAEWLALALVVVASAGVTLTHAQRERRDDPL